MARSRLLRSSGNLYMQDDDIGIVNPMWANCPLLQIVQDPGIAHVHFDDFHRYVAGDWVIATTETGAATEALADEAGGVLLITNGTADDDSDELQFGTVADMGAILLAPSKPMWFEARLKVSDAILTDMIIGIMETTATPIGSGVVDGVYFLKDDGDANIDFHCEKNSNDTTADTGVDIVAANYNRYGIYFDGAGEVEFWIDGVLVGTSTTNVPDDELMRFVFGLQNGEAAAKTMSLDYVKWVQLR